MATQYAWALLGLPYIWGGDDPMAGFDCSGLVVEILKAAGVLPADGDWTADQLYQRFAASEQGLAYGGCLAFWRRGGRMTHVEYCINPSHTIGASGGGSSTLTVADAIRQNAYVKLRPRKPGAVLVDPFQTGAVPV